MNPERIPICSKVNNDNVTCECKGDLYTIKVITGERGENGNDEILFQISANPLDTVGDIKDKIAEHIQITVEDEDEDETAVKLLPSYLYLTYEKCDTLYNERIYDMIKDKDKNITPFSINAFCENVKTSSTSRISNCKQQEMSMRTDDKVSQLQILNRLDAYNRIVQLGVDNLKCIMKFPMGVQFPSYYPVTPQRVPSGIENNSEVDDVSVLAQFGNIYKNTIHAYIYNSRLGDHLDYFPALRNEQDKYRIKHLDDKIPMVYSLVANKSR